jgi:hypothetical protein
MRDIGTTHKLICSVLFKRACNEGDLPDQIRATRVIGAMCQIKNWQGKCILLSELRLYVQFLQPFL